MSNPFFEQQQQLFKMWNDAITSKIPGMETYQNMYKNMMPDMSKYWSSMPNMTEYWNNNMPNVAEYWNKVSESITNPQAAWNAFFKAFPNNTDFTKMWSFNNIPGMEVYTQVFDLWKGIGTPATFVENSQEKAAELMRSILKQFVPAGLPLFDKSQELMDTCVNFYKSVMSPWMEIDPTILNRIAAGDKRAYRDFFREVNEKYEQTFAKVFNMMGMGANREANEDQMKAMGAYIKVLFSAGELMTLMMDAGKDSMKLLVDRYQANIKEGIMVTTFREFYDLWYKVTEEVLLELLNTEEFSKAFGAFADKYAQYMMASNKVYERMLAPLPIPTKSDMDSLYRTVYDLRKDVRDLRRELDALKPSK